MPAKMSIFAEYVTFNSGPIFTLHVLSCLILRIEKKINEKKRRRKKITLLSKPQPESVYSK